MLFLTFDEAGAYFLYSPESAKYGSIAHDGVGATIPLEFWIETSHMYFCCRHVEFTLRIPIYEIDKVKETDQAAPLRYLYHSNSARWDAFKYFIATAADILEGSLTLDMERFIQGARSRDDMIFVQENEMVTLKYEHQPNLNQHAPSFPRDATRIWYAILCD